MVMRADVLIRRFVLCVTMAIATGAATWVNPPSAESSPPTVLRGSGIEAPPRAKVVAPPPVSGESASPAEISVARWEFSPATPGRPVYLSMTLDGTQAAIGRMQAGSPPTIQVRWARDNAGAAPGAPDLVTDLTVGRPGLAAAFDGDVRRRGYFEWHTWARKDHLSPGAWTVSVTYPDGQPLPCGADAQPCRFTINVG
jgi:hypothetical protein